MKNLLLLALFLFSGSLFANNANVEYVSEENTSIEELNYIDQVLAESTGEDKQSFCYAYAQCNGYRVSCSSSGVGCVWRSVSRTTWGYYDAGVTCQSIDSWGNTYWATAWCSSRW